MSLKPEVSGPTPLTPLGTIIVLISGIIIALLVTLAVPRVVSSVLRYDAPTSSQVMMGYVPQLHGKAEVLRDSAGTASLVRACLYDEDFHCDWRWEPIASIDIVAGRPPGHGEAGVLGCVYVERSTSCLCERHEFILPVSTLR